MHPDFYGAVIVAIFASVVAFLPRFKRKPETVETRWSP